MSNTAATKELTRPVSDTVAPSADVNASSPPVDPVLSDPCAAAGSADGKYYHGALSSVCSSEHVTIVTNHMHALMNLHISLGNNVCYYKHASCMHDGLPCPLCADITVGRTMTVFVVLNEAREKWYFIGEGLGLGTADLDEIHAQHHPDKAMCLRKVLQRRIQRGRLTRSTLCISLRGQLVERDDVAQRIEALPLDTSVSCLKYSTCILPLVHEYYYVVVLIILSLPACRVWLVLIPITLHPLRARKLMRLPHPQVGMINRRRACTRNELQ